MPVSISARARVLLVVAVLVVLALAGGGWWFLKGSSTSLTGGPASSSSSTGQDDGGVSILLDLAKTAMTDKHLVAPQGANAYEFYMSVLQLDPTNKVALAQLHDNFNDATDQVERDINDNNLDEAQRELLLLREFDGTNYLLTLLGAKLDAQRQAVIRQDEARAAAIQARATMSGGGIGMGL